VGTISSFSFFQEQSNTSALTTYVYKMITWWRTPFRYQCFM